jgi:hypothetical protein
MVRKLDLDFIEHHLLNRVHTEHYCEAIGVLVSSLSDKPELLRRIVEYVFNFLRNCLNRF